MKEGEKLNLTDGKGSLLATKIISDNKKKCEVDIESVQQEAPASRKISIGISLVKNNNRFEWFLEKATEIGIQEIIPLICERTEKQKFRFERMQGILVSAMLQSQQCWLPVLQEPVAFRNVAGPSPHQQKFIAHCLDEKKGSLASLANSSLDSQIILIGPEGDFTKQEIELAMHYHFVPVTLGQTRLRTETAGMVAATLLKISE
ncbi:MAG: rRNA ((1498)-N(3))-methyltransferase [Chitinophagaceae bacterium]|nr:rRNA ((1498)-N(3))-methyltransferase [Chitinophagaceae bacterium]